jgi:hypothetical protein
VVFRIPEMLPLSLAKDTKQQTKWEDTMKKINLFNRNINSPSYRRRPVSGGIVENRHTAEARCPGQAKRGLAPQEIFHCETMKNINVCDAGAHMRSHWIPAFAGMTAIVIAALFATPSFAEPTELDKKTVASKAYVDTKQDKITTGLVEFNGNPELMLPAITTYDTTNGLVSNKIGILDWQTAADVEGPLDLFSYGGGRYGSEMDNYVPTVRAVAESLQYIWDRMPFWNALTWNNTQSTAINAYNSTFGNGTNNWTGTSTYLINGQFLANSLALKQNKLPAKSTGNAAPTGNQAVVLNTAGEPSNVYTTAGKDLALTAKSGAQKVMNYIDGTTASATFATSQGLTEAQVKSALVSLELLKDVYSELNSKITNNALPTGTTGTVVTYNGTNQQTGVQQFTETAMTGTVTYTNGTLDNANNIATIAAVGTRQKKRTCAGYEPGHENEADYCWLWNFPDD